MADAAAGAPARGSDAGTQAGAGGAGAGEDFEAGNALGESCELVSTTAVGWTEPTEVGTPEEVFGDLAGTCQAPFSWDGTGWSDMLTVEPATGQSTVTATVEIDQASARWIETAAADPGIFLLCFSTLEIDGTVTLELGDAAIVSGQPVTVAVSADSSNPRIQFVLDREQIGDWISIEPRDENADVTMSAEMMPVGEACAGSIGLSVAVSQGDGTGVGTGQSGFATWSATGCEVGQTAVNAGEPFEGVDLVEVVEEAFDQQELEVTWQDGTETVLALGASVTETEVCAENLEGGTTVVILPVDITSSTADARVDLRAAGTARVLMRGGAVTSIDLELSADFSCASEADTLPYSAVDCASTESMTAQLGISYSPAGSPPYTAAELLELYVRLRDSTAPPGAFDRIDQLQLSE